MANTGKDASGSTIFIWTPFSETGVDNTNAYGFGSVFGFSRNASKQLITLDTSTPANNRPLPVLLLSGDSAGAYSSSNQIPIQSSSFSVSATITRAANVTTYSVNDVVGGAITLTGIGNSGQFIMINSIDLIMNITALPTGLVNANLILYLYNVTPPSAVADNGAFTLPSGDRASCLTPGGISLGAAALAPGGGSCVLQLDNLSKLIKLSSANLFAYLVTTAAFTPAANSETYTLRINTVQP
jgi:hypothetical protein